MRHGSVGGAMVAMALSVAACTDDGSPRRTDAVAVGTTAETMVDDPLGTSNAASRPAMFGLESRFGDVRLEVAELSNRGGQAIGVTLSRDGSPVRDERPTAGAGVHLFVMGGDLDYLEHEALPSSSMLTDYWTASNTGATRVVVAFDDGEGPIVLGADVVVREESDFDMGFGELSTHRFRDTAVELERDGFDFRLLTPWSGEPVYEAPAWLTVVRRSDLALTFAVATMPDDQTFHFEPRLPGPGDYVALVEFRPEGAGWYRVPFAVGVDDALVVD